MSEMPPFCLPRTTAAPGGKAPEPRERCCLPSWSIGKEEKEDAGPSGRSESFSLPSGSREDEHTGPLVGETTARVSVWQHPARPGRVEQMGPPHYGVKEAEP